MSTENFYVEHGDDCPHRNCPDADDCADGGRPEDCEAVDPAEPCPCLIQGSYYWIDPANGLMTALAADDGRIDPESVTAVDLDAVDDDLRAQIEEAVK